MRKIEPPGANTSRFFTCSCLSIAGCFFWAIMFGCIGAITLALGINVAEGNIFAQSDYITAVIMSIGALAFMLSMISLAFVFFGYALYQHNRKEKPAREPVRRRVVLLFFGLYIGAIILAAGIPGYAIAYFGSPIWLKLLSLPTGLVYFIFGLVMLWLSMQEYEHLALE